MINLISASCFGYDLLRDVLLLRQKMFSSHPIPLSRRGSIPVIDSDLFGWAWPHLVRGWPCVWEDEHIAVVVFVLSERDFEFGRRVSENPQGFLIDWGFVNRSIVGWRPYHRFLFVEWLAPLLNVFSMVFGKNFLFWSRNKLIELFPIVDKFYDQDPEYERYQPIDKENCIIVTLATISFQNAGCHLSQKYEAIKK